MSGDTHKDLRTTAVLAIRVMHVSFGVSTRVRSLMFVSATEDRLHCTDDSGVLGYTRDTQVHSGTLGYTRIYSNTLGYTQVHSVKFVNTRRHGAPWHVGSERSSHEVGKLMNTVTKIVSQRNLSI